MSNLRFYINTFAVSLHGFVIMPHHVHLLLTMGKTGNLSQFMGRLKERTAKQIIRWCEEYGEDQLLEIFFNSAQKYKKRSQYQVWQERFDALVIYEPATFSTKLEYIHNNPLQEKWHLCDRVEDYKFSSARYYLKNENVGVPIEVEVTRGE
jgi:REP element-mobilizing transposase RayT